MRASYHLAIMLSHCSALNTFSSVVQASHSFIHQHKRSTGQAQRTSTQTDLFTLHFVCFSRIKQNKRKHTNGSLHR
jgi:hypothetical protein